jgi:transketolase N-terminal domain/subunit
VSGGRKSENLATFMQPLSALNGRPNRRELPGVEANTVPLVHGLPIGVGCVAAAALAKVSWRRFVVLDDSELQEGSNWEAAMCAGNRQLENLVAVVDRDRLQQGAHRGHQSPRAARRSLARLWMGGRRRLEFLFGRFGLTRDGILAAASERKGL